MLKDRYILLIKKKLIHTNILHKSTLVDYCKTTKLRSIKYYKLIIQNYNNWSWFPFDLVVVIIRVVDIYLECVGGCYNGGGWWQLVASGEHGPSESMKGSYSNHKKVEMW